MKYAILIMLMFLTSCSTPGKNCSYDVCNDCSQMNRWGRVLISGVSGDGPASDSSGINGRRKVRVLAVSSSLNRSISLNVARSNALKLAIDEGGRHVARLVTLEVGDSSHAANIAGFSFIYRGRSYEGGEGQKKFSDIMKRVQVGVKTICTEYDVESRRSVALLEYDLTPFDR